MFLGVMKNKRMHLGHTWSHLGQILDANRVWLTLLALCCSLLVKRSVRPQTDRLM